MFNNHMKVTFWGYEKFIFNMVMKFSWYFQMILREFFNVSDSMKMPLCEFLSMFNENVRESPIKT